MLHHTIPAIHREPGPMWEVMTPPVCSQWICWKPNCQAVSSAARRAEGDSRGVTPSQRSRWSSWNRWAYSRIIRGITRSMLPWYSLRTGDGRGPSRYRGGFAAGYRTGRRRCSSALRPRRKSRLRMTKAHPGPLDDLLGGGDGLGRGPLRVIWRALATWSTTRHWPAEDLLSVQTGDVVLPLGSHLPPLKGTAGRCGIRQIEDVCFGVLGMDGLENCLEVLQGGRPWFGAQFQYGRSR